MFQSATFNNFKATLYAFYGIIAAFRCCDENFDENCYMVVCYSVFLDTTTWGRQIQKCSNSTRSGFKFLQMTVFTA